MQEIRALTGLRGIAAMAIVFYHFRPSDIEPERLRIVFDHGYLMVDLFLVLSGFILTMTYGTVFSGRFDLEAYRIFLSRRIARIYPLYAIMTTIAAGLVALGWMDRWPGPEVPVTLAINYLMIQNWLMVPSLDTPGWSIGAEWSAYLAFPLFVAIAYRPRPAIALAFIVASLLGLYVMTQLPILADQPKRTGLLDIWHYGTVFPVVRCLLTFLIGVAACRLMEVEAFRQALFMRWTGFAIVVAILAMMALADADIVIVALFPFLIASLSRDETPLGRMMGSPIVYRLGVLSYAVYLIHNLLNYPLYWLAAELTGLGAPIPYLTAMLVFAAISLALADLAHRTIEMPGRRKLRALFEARAPREQLKPSGR